MCLMKRNHFLYFATSLHKKSVVINVLQISPTHKLKEANNIYYENNVQLIVVASVIF